MQKKATDMQLNSSLGISGIFSLGCRNSKRSATPLPLHTCKYPLYKSQKKKKTKTCALTPDL